MSVEQSTVESERSVSPRARGAGLFRSFWRWHFYASALVIPVLLMLAVTGLIYLFRFQLEPAMHADLMQVDVPAGTVQQPYDSMLASAQKAFPDAELSMMTEPREPGRSAVFSGTNPDGSSIDVYVDPWTGTTLGSLDPDTTLSGYAVRLHGDLMTGKPGDAVIELGACWALVMALTGYYLFLAGRKARARRRAARAPGAATRQRHALVGAVAGVGILMLVVSGLPWTGFWGERVQAIATHQGSSLWSLDPGALSEPGSTLDESLPHSHHHEVPWAQGATEVPDAGDAEGSVASLDTATTVARGEGLRSPMTVVLPTVTRGSTR